MTRSLSLLALAVFVAAAAPAQAGEGNIPISELPGVTVTLVAESPEIVTPTGVAVDSEGRLFVQENHTHHRPEGYPGPAEDRILVFEDIDGDGSWERRAVFYEGLVWSTDLHFGKDGWLYAATRSEIYRLRDTDGDLVADEVEGVIEMESDCEYPHDGISGLCFDRDGRLHFGLGENLGHDYTIHGRDGARISGGGEGGSIYRCRADGTALRRIGTGIWNPFGMGFDTAGNLFATDNDPGSSPPCRLLHVVDGADFGYEFRYGRSGNHPLVTWTGEFPGTVGMVCGTAEAPCGIVDFGSGKLLIASWADHRVDLHELTPEGASFSATRTPFLSGGNEFRPVHFTWSADRRSLFLTDWVSSSYPVHGDGKIWKIAFDEPVPTPDDEPHAEILRARTIRTMREPAQLPGLIQLLDDRDPFIRAAAIDAMRGLGDRLLDIAPDAGRHSPRQRAGLLVALKKSGIAEAEAMVPRFLEDEDRDVRFAAVKWIADAQLDQYRPLLEEQLERSDLDTRTFLGVMAALDRVDGEKPRDIPEPGKLIAIALDESTAPKIRAMALRLVPPDYSKLKIADLRKIAMGGGEDLQVEAIRSLQSFPDPKAREILAKIAADEDRATAQRAEAIIGIALAGSEFAELLAGFAVGDDPVLRDEARRALIGIDPDALSGPGRIVEPKPSPADLDAWEILLGDAPGDPEAGRRLFFHPKVGTCARCHRMEGRGVRVGPDLTTVWKRNADSDESLARAWILESILQPGTFIAPQFLPWKITMKDGTDRVGLPLRKGGKSEAYLGVDGREFSLRKPEIDHHEELQMSLMPAGLLEQMTVQEVRDLLAYLSMPK